MSAFKGYLLKGIILITKKNIKIKKNNNNSKMKIHKRLGYLMGILLFISVIQSDA